MFQRRRQVQSRQDTWDGLAESLGLESVIDGAALLAERLDLDSTPLGGPVYRARDTGALQVYTFDIHSDAWVHGQQELAVAGLLVAEEEFCPLPLRFSRRLRSQLAGIQAGASQAQLVVSGADDGFDERVTVVARDPAIAGTVLTGPVRQAVTRLLERDEATPILTASRNQLMAQTKAGQFELTGLTYLLTDLMALYVALRGAAAADA